MSSSNIEKVRIDAKPIQLTVVFDIDKREILEIRDVSPEDRHSRTIALQYGIAEGSRDALLDYLYDHFFEIDIIYQKEGSSYKPVIPSSSKTQARSQL